MSTKIAIVDPKLIDFLKQPSSGEGSIGYVTVSAVTKESFIVDLEAGLSARIQLTDENRSTLGKMPAGTKVYVDVNGNYLSSTYEKPTPTVTKTSTPRTGATKAQYRF